MEKEVLINRKQTAFRLREDLLNKIKEEAKKENRSINNYVETILLDAIYREPNETTLEAIREAKQGKLAGTIDTTDMETLIQSVSE
ncbi:MAG TPA: toxin-antitoxin system protein [Petrimonas sp.]|uniref:toxin-antitoxin system protein n=1 Tax=Petrimonas sp. TaxID=2023866 RepID=UPI001750B3E2|nr:toxin-antitoxin system protein [Petrimonas sp.]